MDTELSSWDCPHCESPMFINRGGLAGYYVACCECGVRGPNAGNPNLAVRQWDAMCDRITSGQTEQLPDLLNLRGCMEDSGGDDSVTAVRKMRDEWDEPEQNPDE